MKDLPGNYRCKYELTAHYGDSDLHIYSLVGAVGGVHLHVTDYGEDRSKHFTDRYSAGLETHWRSPPSWMQDKAPSNDVCWLLMGPCWHDGTSLYASEHCVPIFETHRDKPEIIFRDLAAYADRAFARDENGFDDDEN